MKKKKKSKKKLKYNFKTIEHYPATKHCHYSGLPSPSAYEKKEEINEGKNRYYRKIKN